MQAVDLVIVVCWSTSVNSSRFLQARAIWKLIKLISRADLPQGFPELDLGPSLICGNNSSRTTTLKAHSFTLSWLYHFDALNLQFSSD